MNKFIIVFLFISTLFSQNVDGEFSLGEISFLIKNIHFEGGYKDRGRNEEFNNGIGSLDIGLIKYGFSNIDLSGDLNAYNNRAKVKYKFSGPEFEMSNFKIDVSFDAPNVWDILKEELAHERARIITNTFSDIRESIGQYYKTYNELPADLNRLLINGMLSRSIINKVGWDIEYLPPDQIVATSNNNMPGGADKIIKHVYTGSDIVDYFVNDNYYYYSWETTGYGQYDNYRKPRPVKNNVKFSIGKVNQYFGASGSVDLNERNQAVEIKLDKAGYSISGVNASFIVNRSSKSTFDISDFKTEAKNITLEFDSYNDIPIIEKAAFEISLKNLEVNFPKDVQDDPEFKEIADYLNINSGKFRIRQIDLNLTFNRGRDLKLKGTVDTQFGKAVIDGSFSINQPVRYDSDLTIDKFTIEISNLSQPINKFIEVWEEGTGNILPRKGKSIYLEISGDLNDPQVKGLDIRF